MKLMLNCCLLVCLLAMSGCHRTVALDPKQAEFHECFRLDREPVFGWETPRCQPNANSAKTGTYHRELEREVQAELLPITVPAEHAAKMPTSECLWVGRSALGSGEELAPQWESTMTQELDSNTTSNGTQTWQFSACRFDTPYPRISLSSAGTPQLRQCFSNLYFAGDIGKENSFINIIKSTCDLDMSFLTPSTELVAASLTSDGYDMCGSHDLPPAPVNEYPFPAGFCTRVKNVGGPTAQFEDTVVPRQDSEYIIRGAVERTLSPRVRTVIDERLIARPLNTSTQPATWRTAVLADNAPDLKRWKENFTEFVRVRSVRVFSVTNQTTDDRQYLVLDGARLTLDDPDDLSGAASECEATDGIFDLYGCQIDVNPTLRIANLDQPGSTPLRTPLGWQVESDEIQNDGREYYLEFDLESVFRTRSATLLADVPYIDFGGINAGEYNQHRVTVTNVGNGHFVIDDVLIDPQYGQPSAFSVQRLDDPVHVPHPLLARDVDNQTELSIAPWATEYSLLEWQEDEHHMQVSSPLLDGMEVDVLGIPMRFVGDAAVLQTTQPDLSMTIAPPGARHVLTFPVFREWQLPFTLAPGQTRTLQVMGKPPTYGEFEGRLVVSGYPLHAPGAPQDIRVTLDAYGLLGPQADLLPTLLNFPRGSTANNTLNAIIVSHGDANLGIGDISIAPHDSGHASADDHAFSITQAPATGAYIAPGDSHVVTVHYDPGCFSPVPVGGHHLAVLRIETDAGTREIALRGNSARWAATQSACQPNY